MVVLKKNEHGQMELKVLDGGKGAPRGVMVNYWLNAAPAADAVASLAFRDEAGKLIAEFKVKPADYDKKDEKEKALAPGPWLPVKPGMNRFIWDMRYPGATKVLGNKLAGEANVGPLVLPGHYQVQLTIGDQTLTQRFEIVNDPRVKVAQKDLQAQLDLMLSIYNKLSDCYKGINLLRDVVAQAKGWAERMGKKESGAPIVAAAKALIEKLEKIEDELIVPGEQKDTFGLNMRSRLNTKLASLIAVVGSADRAPTQQAHELTAVYAGQIDEQLANLQAVLDSDLEALNSLIHDASQPAIVV
jgi:hypothetical protein